MWGVLKVLGAIVVAFIVIFVLIDLLNSKKG